jgi:hypothetical protein
MSYNDISSILFRLVLFTDKSEKGEGEMSNNSRLDKLATKAFLSYHQDGTIDILIGWIMLSIGVGMATGWSGPWALLGFITSAALYTLLKRSVTIPRMGYVEFAQTPRREVLTRIIYPLVVCTFMLVLLLTAAPPKGVVPGVQVWTPSEAWPELRLWTEGKGTALFGVAALVFFGVVALATEIRRLYGYALLSLVVMTGGQLLGLKTHIPVFALGGTIIAVGAALLVRFLRKHPILSPEETYSEEQLNHASS